MKTKEHPLESLTRGEEEIMQYLWQLEKGSVNDLLSVIQEPKPNPKKTTSSTNAISTITGKNMQANFLLNR